MNGTLQLVINIGAVVAALTAIIGFPLAIVKLWPLLKRAVTIGASLEKLPEMSNELTALTVGQRAQGETLAEQNDTLTGQNVTLAKLTGEIRTVKQQVQNSHVTNLRDDVDEMIGKIDTVHDKLDDHLKTCPPTTTINVNPGGIS